MYTNENAQHTFKKTEKMSLLCHLTWREHIFMVSKVFEPLKFYYMYIHVCSRTFAKLSNAVGNAR